MGKENPFRAWKLIVICVVCFHNVSSKSLGEDVKTISDSLIDKIKVCPTVYVIGNSSYVKSCGALKYTEEFIEDDVNFSLCMIVYDTTSKICEYFSKVPLTISSQTGPLLPSSVQQLDKDIEKFELNNDSSDICKNISSIFNKLNHSKVEGLKDLIPYIKYSQNKLLSKNDCQYTCHSGAGTKIKHLCAYLLWANQFFTSLNPIKVENYQEENLPGKETQSKPKEVLQENNNKKEDLPVIDKNEKQKIIDNAPNAVSESENQQNKQGLTSTNNEKTNDMPKQLSLNTPTNEAENKPKDQKQLDELNNHGNLPILPKKGTDVEESKKSDVNIPHQLPPDEANQDADSASVEEPLNKNDDPEEGIDRENADNDQKESNNQGVQVSDKNQEYNDELQQRQKAILPEKTLKEEEESHFFTYFSVISLLCIVLYISYHNKQKILAILLEGRKSRRGRGSRRRPSTASYRKLDSNLEEAISSQCQSNVTHVIY